MSDRSDLFAGVRLKLKRAWQQLDGLKAEINAFTNEDPHPYVPQIHFDRKTQMLTASVQVQKRPDPMWGVMVGEIIHNLRSALDHIVRELVILKTGRTPRTNKNQFPIFEHQAGFRGRGTKMFLHDVSPAGIALIESEQPFPKKDGGTGEGIDSPLWHVKELSDHDKHRTLHVTGTMVSEFKFTLPPLKRDATVDHQTLTGPGPIQQDAVLARAHFPGFTEWPFTKDQVHCQLRTNIAFDQRTPAVGGWLVLGTLADAANRAERISRRIAEEIFNIEL